VHEILRIDFRTTLRVMKEEMVAMRKIIIAALVLIILLAASGWAWGGYIFEDPIMVIGGHQVNVMIGQDVPQGETASAPTELNVLVPSNVPAQLVDPMGAVVSFRALGPQYGPVRISLVVVKVARTDQGHGYPVRITVSDDAGYSFTMSGRAGSQVVVPYIHWSR
jgi:hypothetical protein